jgi:translation initiation factor 2 alpha subunit (eIF-2alpha)
MKWETKYGTPYDMFHTQVIDDQVFLRQLNQAHPMWEADFLEWASQQQEFDQWMKQLESILKS